MAKTCIQCGKKMGMFHKAVDGIYCSLECQGEAQKQIVAAERQAQLQRAEAARQAELDAKEAAARQVVEQAHQKLLRTCPKCGRGWSYSPGGGPGGADSGTCAKCGFAASFTGIEPCPSCAGKNFLVSADGSGQCPRCKYRS